MSLLAFCFVVSVGTPPAAAERRGFLLQVYDPDGYLAGPVHAHVVGVAGTVRDVDPLDDGEAPDVTAGDKLYSAPVPGFPDEALEVALTDSQRTWSAAVFLSVDDERALVRLKLESDGTATPIGEIKVAELPPPKPEPGVPAFRPADAATPRAEAGSAETIDPGPGVLVWAVGASGLGLALGTTLALLGRFAGIPAPVDAPPADTQPPMRVAAGDITRALAGPLRGHRVVVLGPPQPGTLACLEVAPLPDELVAAVERIATVPGPPVALLVTDPARLDPPHAGDPVRALARRVGGRFPLWVVGGPTGWATWRSDSGGQ